MLIIKAKGNKTSGYFTTDDPSFESTLGNIIDMLREELKIKNEVKSKLKKSKRAEIKKRIHHM